MKLGIGIGICLIDIGVSIAIAPYISGLSRFLITFGIGFMGGWMVSDGLIDLFHK